MMTAEQLAKLQKRADWEESYAIRQYMAAYHLHNSQSPSRSRVRHVARCVWRAARLLSGLCVRAYRWAVRVSEQRRCA